MRILDLVFIFNALYHAVDLIVEQSLGKRVLNRRFVLDRADEFAVNVDPVSLFKLLVRSRKHLICKLLGGNYLVAVRNNSQRILGRQVNGSTVARIVDPLLNLALGSLKVSLSRDNSDLPAVVLNAETVFKTRAVLYHSHKKSHRNYRQNIIERRVENSALAEKIRCPEVEHCMNVCRPALLFGAYHPALKFLVDVESAS